MENRNKFIFIIGLYWSGSSAVFEWLKGFEDDVVVVPGEFDIFRKPGKIGPIMSAKTVTAKRNIASTFLKTLLKAKLRKQIVSDKNYIKIKNGVKIVLNNLVGKNYKMALIDTVKFDESDYANSITIQYLNKYLKNFEKPNFEEIKFWKKWLDEILLPYSKTNKTIILDQPIFLTSHSEIWSQLFSDFKIVMVHRNPADQFAEVIRQGIIHVKRGYRIDHFDSKNHYNEEDLAVSFADMLKEKYERLLDFREIYNEHLISLSFEEFVQNYLVKSEELKKALEIKMKNEITLFDPNKSLKNIGISNQDWAKEQISEKGYKYFNKIESIRNSL